MPKVDYTFSRAHGAEDGSDCEVLCLAFVEADSPLLASAGNDRVVRCWDLRNHTCTLLAVLEVRQMSRSRSIVAAHPKHVYIENRRFETSSRPFS